MASMSGGEKFLSTPSVRRATYDAHHVGGAVVVFLSTPSARRATAPRPPARTGWEISIHALREEGDSWKNYVMLPLIYFYPRPPRGGRPLTPSWRWPGTSFLSTPSARRATHVWLELARDRLYFYPRPPRGGRPVHPTDAGAKLIDFYPRPPRGGRL